MNLLAIIRDLFTRMEWPMHSCGARFAPPRTPRAMTGCGETMIQVAMPSMDHRAQVNARIRDPHGKPPLVDFIARVWMGKPLAL